MKAQLIKVTHDPLHSFSIRQDFIPNVNSNWHFHNEAELILFHKGSGLQFAGDSIQPFSPGDIALIGPGLPHCWQYKKTTVTNEDMLTPYSTVIHFDINILGNRFLQLPESDSLNSVIKIASRGLFISGGKEPGITSLLKKMPAFEGIERILGLVNCLIRIGNSPHLSVLSSAAYNHTGIMKEDDRINSIFDYTHKNFKKKIYLRQIAAEAGMSANAFCRYFKTKTGKTYLSFLIETRIGYACKLLIENKMTNKQICFESGFNSLSYFHRNFQRLKGESPSQFQKRFSSVSKEMKLR